MKKILYAMLPFFLVAQTALAGTCPSRIQYSNGQTLKNDQRFYFDNGNTALSGSRMYYRNGTTFRNDDRIYYPNGSSLKSGSRLYYANGVTFRTDDRVYYQNGNTLKSGERLYYPNGNNLRYAAERWYHPNGNTLQNGDRLYYQDGSTIRSAPTRWYWSNGNTLRSEERFYYRSGSTARNSGRLYRENGTTAAGVITLEEAISDVGFINAIVTENSAEHYANFVFNNLGSGLSDLKLVFDDSNNSIRPSFRLTPEHTYPLNTNYSHTHDTLLVDTQINSDDHVFFIRENEPNQTKTTLILRTGYQNESVTVSVRSDNSIHCEALGDSTGPGNEFTINADAANVSVVVKPGYDPRVVEAAIRNALAELQ